MILILLIILYLFGFIGIFNEFLPRTGINRPLPSNRLPHLGPFTVFVNPLANKGFSTEAVASSIETRYCQLSKSPASTAPREHNDTALR